MDVSKDSATRSLSDEIASWHLLQLAEQGRGWWPIAQYFASALMSSGATEMADVLGEIKEVIEQIKYLLDHPENIWPGLLPGPPTHIPSHHLLNNRWGGESAKHLLNIADIVGKYPEQNAYTVVLRLDEYLTNSNLIVPQRTTAETIDVTLIRSLEVGGLLACNKGGEIGHIKHEFYTNLSSPDELNDGDILRVELDNWELIDGSEVHNLLN